MQTPPKHCDPIPCTANPSLALNTIREASPPKNQNVNFFQIGLDPPTQGSENVDGADTGAIGQNAFFWTN